MAFTFDGAAKLIVLSPGTVSVSVRDLWSRWVDWLVDTPDSRKWLPAMRSVGGDEIVAGQTSIPVYTYLSNGWRIRPQEAAHTLVVDDGILLVDGGGNPFVPTLGAFTVQVSYQQPVQAITVNTAGSSGPSASDIAAAVLAAMNSTPPGVDVKRVNSVPITGTGAAGSDPWRPA